MEHIMTYSTLLATILTGALCAVAFCSSSPAQAAAMNGKSYCSKLQPLLQPFVNVKLTLHQADDSTTDSLQGGDPQYVKCDFQQQNPQVPQVDVSLHDDSDHRFDDADKKGYAPLAGFGDKARYSVRGAMGMRWVDVVRGSVACEARLTMPDRQINGDWKEAAGKMCEAAFSAR